MERWLATVLISTFGALGCASETGDDDDDSGGDGDSDSDGDGDGDADPVECETLEEDPVVCEAGGVAVMPEVLEPGCGGLTGLRFRLDIADVDTDTRVHRDIVDPHLDMSITVDDPLTFPISSSLQALVNGCEVPPDPAVGYSWLQDDEDVQITLTPGTFVVVEIRERGEPETARLFYRQAFEMPAVLPNILEPPTNTELPAPGRNVSIDVTWTPFDLSAPEWVATSRLDIRAWIQGGGANQIIEDPNNLLDLDGMQGEAIFNAGAFDTWDFIAMKGAMFDTGQNASISVTVVRSVN